MISQGRLSGRERPLHQFDQIARDVGDEGGRRARVVVLSDHLPAPEDHRPQDGGRASTTSASAWHQECSPLCGSRRSAHRLPAFWDPMISTHSARLARKATRLTVLATRTGFPQKKPSTAAYQRTASLRSGTLVAP